MKTVSRGALRARGRFLPWGERTYVMGIINVTPDSFSGDGIAESEAAAAFAQRQAALGSDMLDIGGESTRPGHETISDAAECQRVIPVLQLLRQRLPHAIVSIDTYKPAVLRAAADAGADVVNSIWGLPADLLCVAAERGMPVVAMHNKNEAIYPNGVMEEILVFLNDCAMRAVRAGIPEEHIILDPGIGFAKTADHNVEVLRELKRVTALGFPTLLGTSRKSTLGKLTGREPGARLSGTLATTALAVAAGVDVVRVHDVAENLDAVRIADAVTRGWRPAAWT